MYSIKMWDFQIADITLSSEKKNEKKKSHRASEFTDTEQATLFSGWENITFLCIILMDQNRKLLVNLLMGFKVKVKLTDSLNYSELQSRMKIFFMILAGSILKKAT